MRKKRIQTMIASGTGSDQRSSAWFCSLLCYCMAKCPLYVISVQDTTQNTLYIIWCLVNINNTCDLVRNIRRTTQLVIYGIPSQKSIIHICIYLQESHSQNFHPERLRKRAVRAASTKLCNVYWKQWPLMEKTFMKYLRLKFALTIFWILLSGL